MRTPLSETLCTLLLPSYHKSSERVEKSNTRLELLTLIQLCGQTPVASLVGDRAGHSRHIALCPVAGTLDSHCAVVPILILRDTISVWGPRDPSSWLPCNCHAHHCSILALKQGHLRGHCRDRGENASVLTHYIWNLKRHFLQSQIWSSETPQ